MKTNQTGIKLIKTFEGLKKEAYLCPAGRWTIGYGHTGEEVFPGMKITDKDAETILRADLVKFERAIKEMVAVALNENQFSALVSLCFNVGIHAFMHSTLLKRLNEGNFSSARSEFGRWVFAKGKKLTGLVERRKAEQELFCLT